MKTQEKDSAPEVLRYTVFAVQVCVPVVWKDKDVINFVELEYPSGTRAGWKIRRKKLVHVPCEEREGFTHVVLEA